MRRAGWMLALLFAGLAPALAQQAPVDARARTLLSPAAQDRIVERDALLDRPTRTLPDGRVDAATGVRRALYRIAPHAEAPLRTASPEAAARRFLATRAGELGLADGADLALLHTRRSPGGAHVRFRQTFAGLPVFNRYVQVNLDQAGRPTFVVSGYAPELTGAAAFDPTPGFSAGRAADYFRAAVTDPDALVAAPELVVVATEPPRLAYHALVWPTTAGAEWSVLIDARTGAPLSLFDQTVKHRRAAAPSTLLDARHAADASFRLGKAHFDRRAGPAADGQGLVFDPDPLTTSGRSYAPPYVDADDADVPELNAERLLVPLPDLTLGSDGFYRLDGPYVRIEEGAFNRQTEYKAPAETDPSAFRYLRSDDRFEAVNIYYHIDRNQRYVQSLGFADLQNGPISVYPLGEGADDNSQYWPSRNFMTFGHGGIDDAEDADVILHEYGHALLEDASNDLRGTFEGQSLHEGWADYWAGTYRRGLVESGAVPPTDWRRIFPWDGNNPSISWFGRTLDSDDVFDGFSGRLYTDGDLWATTLMEIYDVVGKQISDRLNLQANYYLAPPTSYRDAAEALLQADRDLFDGAHTSVLIDALDRRGYLDAADFAPVVAHIPATDTEQLGGTIPLEIEASGLAFPIDRVQAVVQVGAQPQQTVPAEALGDGRYLALLPVPDDAARIAYFVEAFDTGGRRAVLPAGAPNERFVFQVGPDTEPPAITSTPILQASLVGWPARVSAVVEDNLGVDTVYVEYTVVSGETGLERTSGAFGLARLGDAFGAPFPFSVDLLEAGDEVRYRILARDVSSAGNVAVLPEAGAPAFSFVVSATGTLAKFDFEGPTAGLDAVGAWARGAPTYGVRVAYSGTTVWATEPDERYPATPGRSTLTLPSFDLSAFEEAYLIFRHWYDTEFDGSAGDGDGGRTLFDGGNVQVSTDGGATWAPAAPREGYPGVISPLFGNPMGGEPAFGGYSFGWQRAVVPLPAGPDVRVRFAFGTDDGNSSESVSFAGWVLDDVELSITPPPPDSLAPTVLAAPPARIEIPLSEGPPGNYVPATLTLRLEDETGIARVTVDYDASVDGLAISGRARLAMSPTDRTVYRGLLLPELESALPGDRITYRIRVTDPDGNVVVVPSPDDPPLDILYLFSQRTDALIQVTATGGWTNTGTGWALADRGGGARVSSLVFNPIDLPTDADRALLSLRHRYVFGPGEGGNVKLSADGGLTWTVVEPTGGYDATWAADAPLPGEPVFTGASLADSAEVVGLFDLSAWEGRQVQLRIDAAHATREATWAVERAVLELRSLEGDTFETVRTLALHANFPDPFRGTTTLSYTLPESATVRLAVYDVLGRRVQLLVDENQPAGTYSRVFDGTRLSSGMYLVRLSVGDAELIETMTLLR